MRYACISTSSKQLAIKSRINFTLNQARTSSKFQMKINFDIDFRFSSSSYFLQFVSLYRYYGYRGSIAL